MTSEKNVVRAARGSTMALVLASGLLSACASIQVDVDVYKGPFAQEPEIQVMQYASLAISAKPVLDDLHATLKNKRLLKEGAAARPLPGVVAGSPVSTKERCIPTVSFEEYFLCGILDLYETRDDSDPTTLEKSARSFQGEKGPRKLGLGDLTQNMAEASRLPAGAYRDAEVEKAIIALNEALVYFAQKVLFTVNNQLLFGGATETEKIKIDRQSAVLQSLGNTILVQANDLQRQKNYDTANKKGTAAQKGAILAAFRLSPSAAFDTIVKQLKEQKSTAPLAGPIAAQPAAAAPQALELEKQKTLLVGARKTVSDFRAEIAPLLAAHRSVVAELPAALVAQSVNAADLQAAKLDRNAIAALFPDEAMRDADLATDGALKPMMDWFDLESSAGVAVAPGRAARLSGAKGYLVTENARLVAGPITGADSRDDVLKAVKANITQKSDLASRNLAVLTQEVKALEGSIATLEKKVIKLDAAHGARTAAEAETVRRTGEKNRVVAVVESLRKDVVEQGEAAQVSGAAGMRSLLMLKLAALAPAAASGLPSNDDIALARLAVASLAAAPPVPCGTNDVNACDGETSTTVIDNQIASLRAQHIHALAVGDTTSANHIMAAITAAYSERTQKIYLRPASDYLRSVYSSTSLQDGTDKQYRNMLTDWAKYYWNPFEKDKTTGKEQNEKLYWQNVNKVSVSGGGATNYVLAKDDVGNWYVKAYSADPEAIFKSATSLAMFSAGKGLNVNLLRRLELQRQLDDPKNGLSDTRRAELRTELKETNRQDGLPLLKVKDRYAARYAKDTAQQAGALYETISGLPAKVRSAVTETPDKPAACEVDKLIAGLPAVEKTYLEPARARLEKLISANAAAAEPADADKTAQASTTDQEKAIQAALTGMHLYTAQVHRTLAESSATDCDPWQRAAAANARSYGRAQVLAMAAERKQSIERYEDALASIADIAGAK